MLQRRHGCRRPICRPSAGQNASRSGQDAHSWTIDRTIHIQTRGSSCRAATGRLEVRSFGSRSGAPPHLRCPDPTFQPSACRGSDGEWCNGSTTDSDSVCLGSNPGSPANFWQSPLETERFSPLAYPGPPTWSTGTMQEVGEIAVFTFCSSKERDLFLSSEGASSAATIVTAS